ncbi:formate/nitrite transporter family protein [Streptococcus ruminantium]|uniref:Formate/nitrite transporter family protein n=1 Tax=Streptococcus ruminantium TaxID=1917441 RepID=A0ABU1B4J6_9STRE|nr:formate/nitrite transporter family protein [Streptococcus ruminantium]MDQ8760001.1 formate/nitrite transporter family protein [Streptococcus ruminantium]MDQ8765367.1 formate/nitrite transporter family protein [Streptococcus ruminantium]MDQ8767550.1 formate/nitrite transporter family protein [Streptococcus ruminantium]MDQ8769222.1 formate/nitrite transporter family protein [Streptococcus ruminantium]MDQ8775137.1 formate/nitrite transporter family protein [Streptococcus ruminantium]
MAAQQDTLIYNIDKSIRKKADLIENNYFAYAVRSIMASVYLAIGLAISVYTADKLNHIVDGLGKFSYGLMFGWCLVMILYMNAELGTSNMMYMTSAIHRKVIPTKTALKILATCIFFNFVGAVLVCFLLSLTSPYQHIDQHSYLFEATVAKLAKTPLTQFVEGIFANIVVNIAVFVTMRMKDDAGRVISLIFIIFIFAFLGFEHVIANFSTFSLAFFSNGGPVEGMNILSILSNFLFSGLGNYAGGGLLIGLLYSWLSNKSKLYVD